MSVVLEFFPGVKRKNMSEVSFGGEGGGHKKQVEKRCSREMVCSVLAVSGNGP